MAPTNFGGGEAWVVCEARFYRAEVESTSLWVVEICWDLRNKSGSLLINCWRSTYFSTLSLSVSEIALLHKSAGLMLVKIGIFSCIIGVGDGGGGIETKSMASTIGGLVIFTFLDLAFLASSSTKRLNYSSTETLFLAASINMSIALACKSSSSSKIS